MWIPSEKANPAQGSLRQKGCGGELTPDPLQNQVMNLPHKCHLKLVGVIMVEAILITGVFAQ